MGRDVVQQVTSSLPFISSTVTGADRHPCSSLIAMRPHSYLVVAVGVVRRGSGWSYLHGCTRSPSITEPMLTGCSTTASLQSSYTMSKSWSIPPTHQPAFTDIEIFTTPIVNSGSHFPLFSFSWRSCRLFRTMRLLQDSIKQFFPFSSRHRRRILDSDLSSDTYAFS